MSRRRITSRSATHFTAAIAAAGCGAVLAACGSSAGLSAATDASPMSHAATATTNAAGESAPSMSSMNMSGSGEAVDGIKPIPTQVLGDSDWQNMSIKAQAMTAIPFVVYNGTRERTIKVPKHASFHLMVDLTDARTHWPIPYASVWATIKKQGKVVYDERQWPMISEYMGPHYGDDVALPGAGHYELTLLVSPPVSARHVEYKHVWLKPHRVRFSFNWKPGA